MRRLFLRGMIGLGIGLGVILAACAPTAPTLPPTQVLEPPPSPTTIYIVVTNTPAPTETLPPPSATPTFAPTDTLIPPTVTPTLDGPAAEVCETCGALRLRSEPGSGGDILAFLDANAPLDVNGRTADSGWVQVTTGAGITGWVSADYVDLRVAVDGLPVTGELVEAPAASNSSSSSSSAAVAVAAAAGAPVDLLNVDVVTGITFHARQIFLEGQRLGNVYNAFTRIGDSITASGAFLTRLGSPGRYSLGDYSYFQAAINWFSGPDGRGNNPFDPPLLGAKPGWSTLDILNPDLADPACDPGETPLECDYRLVKPSVALIMLGTNDAGGVPTETFAANLRRIVEITIAHGIIPVLSTLPPKPYDAYNAARIPEFNQVIVTTARSYDIPLWNYWLALQGLPNDGISADLVHPSVPPDGLNANFDAEHLQYGYNMRNLTALQVLDRLWREAMYDGGRITPEPGVAPVIPINPGVGGESVSGDGGDGYTCPGAPTPRLIVGGQGRVTPGVPNKLRSQPSTASDEVGSMPGEAAFTVIGGPQCADGFTWWQVNYQGTVGWTASGNISEYWVEPAG
jgi:uncharacterized protein YraI